MADWDSLVADMDNQIFDVLTEKVQVNDSYPIAVIWEDIFTEFDAMGGTTPKLIFRESKTLRIRKGDKITRIKTGGIFTVNTNPMRENGTISVLL